MPESTRDSLFAAWVKRFHPLLIRIAKAYAATPSDQDDLAQEILLQLWLSLSRFRGDATEITWVYRVSLNTALTWRRSQTRRRKHIPITLVDPDGLEAGNRPSPSDNTAAPLYDAIRQILPADASVILMHLDGLPHDQIADVLGITSNHVAVRIHRTKKKLAQLLKGLDDDV